MTFKSRLVVPGKLRLTILKHFIFNTSVLIFGVFVLFGFFQPSLCVTTEHYQVTVFFFYNLWLETKPHLEISQMQLPFRNHEHVKVEPVEIQFAMYRRM